MPLPPQEGSIEEFLDVYLARGWSLIPVRPQNKIPMIEWKQYQTEKAPPGVVHEWRRTFPDCNWGVVTGAISNIIVVDYDGDEGVRNVRASGREHPQTLVQKTPRGWHAVYQHTGRIIPNGAGIVPKVDIRGDGGFIVVAPSCTSHGRYRWQRIMEPVPVPDWVGADAGTPRAPASDGEQATQEAPTWVREALANGAGQGMRNHTAVRLAGYFHSRALPDDVITEILRQYAGRCTPPMEEKELVEVVRSVSRYHVEARNLGVTPAPTFFDHGNAYRYRWEDLGVSISFRSLRSSTSGIQSELLVESAIPGTPPRIYGPVYFNLLAATSRGTVVQQLTKRVESLDWSRLLDDACRLGIETMRAGEPLQLIRNAPEPSGAGWLLPPILQSVGPTLWFADGASGKSLLALAAAASIDSGMDWGLGHPPTARPRVALLDWEWDITEHKTRLRSLVGDDGLASSEIYYRRCSGPLADQASDLQRILQEQEIGFVIIDSAVPACGGEPELAQPVRDFFDALRQMKVGSLLIAHNNKSGNEMKPYGNVFWFNEARCIWFVGKTQEAGGRDLHVGMFCRKMNSGSQAKPVGFHLQWDEEGWLSIKPEDLSDIPALAERLPQSDQLLNALRGGAMTVQELADELDLKGNQVRALLSRLQEKAIVEKIEPHGSAQPLWRRAES